MSRLRVSPILFTFVMSFCSSGGSSNYTQDISCEPADSYTIMIGAQHFDSFSITNREQIEIECWPNGNVKSLREWKRFSPDLDPEGRIRSNTIHRTIFYENGNPQAHAAYRDYLRTNTIHKMTYYPNGKIKQLWIYNSSGANIGKFSGNGECYNDKICPPGVVPAIRHPSECNRAVSCIDLGLEEPRPHNRPFEITR